MTGKWTKADILRTALGKNKGHNLKLHRHKSFEETGFVRKCYRCFLLKEIERAELMNLKYKDECVL